MWSGWLQWCLQCMESIMAISGCGGGLPPSLCPSAGTGLRFIGQALDITVRGQTVHFLLVHRESCIDVAKHEHHIFETGFRILMISLVVVLDFYDSSAFPLSWVCEGGYQSSYCYEPLYWEKTEKLGNTSALLHQKLSSDGNLLQWDKAMPQPLVSAEWQWQGCNWRIRSCDPLKQDPLTAGERTGAALSPTPPNDHQLTKSKLIRQCVLLVIRMLTFSFKISVWNIFEFLR